MVFHNAGDPKLLVTLYSLMCPTIFSGSTPAGRVGSMSGITQVMPSATPNKANNGKVGRSISPCSMPNMRRNNSTC